MRKLTAYVLTLLMLLCVIVPATATNDPQHIYSNAANSGVRHEVCTTLEGPTVETYYTGDYTFETLSAMNGDALLQVLRTLMVSTHSYQTSYDECRDLSVITDCENGDGTTINLTYTSYVVTMNDYINNVSNGGGWNREHTWPNSMLPDHRNSIERICISSARPILCMLYFAPVALCGSRRPQSVNPPPFTVHGPYFSRIASAMRNNLSSNNAHNVFSGNAFTSAGATNSEILKYLHLYILSPLAIKKPPKRTVP